MFDFTPSVEKSYSAKGALEIGRNAREQEKKLALLAAEYKAEMNNQPAPQRPSEDGGLSSILAVLAGPFRQLASAGRRIFML
jgi:hypothetical protein